MKKKLLNKRYKILQALGQGGFGETFLAEDIYLPSKRRCVVKKFRIKAQISDRDKYLDKFRGEARVLELLGQEHSQIPELYAFFQEANNFYLVQELIEGQTLGNKILFSGKLTEFEAKEIFVELLQILTYIHSKCIVHRDITPNNIIIKHADMKPVLIDFGAIKEILIAELGLQGQFSDSEPIGVKPFMSLEQLSGISTFSNDIYSLGLVILYLLTGHLPHEFPIDQTGEIVWNHKDFQVTEDFAAIVNKAISKNHADRYKTAYEVTKDIKSLSSKYIDEIEYINEAVECGLKGQYADAIHTLTKLVNCNPFIPKAYYLRAVCYSLSNQIDKAISDFKQSMKLDNEYLIAYLSLSKLYIDNNLFEDALETLDSACVVYPNNCEIYYLYGRIYEDTDTILSIYYYSKAIDLSSPEFEDLHLIYSSRGKLYEQTNSFALAANDYQKAIETSKDTDVKVMYLQSSANINKKGGWKYLAIDDLKLAISLNPTKAILYIELVEIYEELKDERSAIYYLSICINLQQNNHEMVLAHYQRGLLLAKEGDSYTALNDFDKAIQIMHEKILSLESNPTSVGMLATLYLMKTQLYFDLGLFWLAINDCTIAITLKPDSGSYYYRGCCYMKTQFFMLAKSDFEQVLLLPDENNIHELSQTNISLCPNQN